MKIKAYYTDFLQQANPALVRKEDFNHGTFVSYARRTTFELVNALYNYFENEPLIDRYTVFIWMDNFCANQPKLTGPLSWIVSRISTSLSLVSRNLDGPT